MSCNATPSERFWRRVDKSGDCWLWTAPLSPRGYGRFRVDGHQTHVHRVAYEWLVGPIPAGLQLDHLCRVRNCVNPAHLEPVTCQVNLLRGDTFAAQNKAKTHCLNGHTFTSANTYVRPNGRRECRACWPARNQAQQARRRTA